MTCPTMDELADGLAEAVSHAEGCDACRERLALLGEIHLAFYPMEPAPEELLAKALNRVREAKEREEQRSVAGALATFLLALMTVAPPMLLGFGSAGGASESWPVLGGIILGSALLAVALEPRLADG